jgi:hypothetical protein
MTVGFDLDDFEEDDAMIGCWDVVVDETAGGNLEVGEVEDVVCCCCCCCILGVTSKNAGTGNR